jgi:hypothetical protein
MPLETAERKEILELLANGKISVESAATLLGQSAASTAGTQTKSNSILDTESELIGIAAAKTANHSPSSFRVQVSDLSTGKSKVRVNIPLGFLRFGLDIGRRFAPELDELDLEQLFDLAESEDGLLIDVLDEEDGEHVRIYVD